MAAGGGGGNENEADDDAPHIVDDERVELVFHYHVSVPQETIWSFVLIIRRILI